MVSHRQLPVPTGCFTLLKVAFTVAASVTTHFDTQVALGRGAGMDQPTIHSRASLQISHIRKVPKGRAGVLGRQFGLVQEGEQTTKVCVGRSVHTCDPVWRGVVGGRGVLARGHSVGWFAFGGAYWPLAIVHSDPLWVRTCFGCVKGAPG
jgi:hypothetical protein